MPSRSGSGLPSLGPRGEGWVAGQVVLGALVAALAAFGPRWQFEWRTALWLVGVTTAACGLALLLAGISHLGGSLTPFPKPRETATLRSSGVYGIVRHPIYGGVILTAVGASLARSPLALVATIALSILLELKSAREEAWLTDRYPEYNAYRRRVRWKFVPGIR